jgi:hypothetical protein
LLADAARAATLDVTAKHRALRVGQYLYVPSFTKGGVFAFRLDEQTGRLAPIEAGPYLQGHIGAEQLTFTPNGSFGFLRTVGEVLPFSVGSDGGLDPRPAQIEGSRGVAIDPSGKFLFSAGAVRPLFVWLVKTASCPSR